MAYLDSFAGLLPRGVAGKILKTAGFSGAGEALALAARLHKSQKPALFLARDAAAAAHLAEEFAFFAPNIPARFLPDWENLPYDQLPPPPDTQTRRMAALSALWHGNGMIAAAATTALFPFPPPDFLAARAFDLRAGQKIDSAALLSRLAACGYARTDRVLAAGEFAAYGGQIDVFPPDAKSPFRLVLEDAEIEQIRLFAPETQMSIGKIGELRLLPAGECDFSADGIAKFRRNFRERFGDVEDDSALNNISEGKPAAGMEFMLPLFFGGAARLLDYASADTLVLIHEDCREALLHFCEQAARRQQHAEIYERRPALPAEELFLSPAALFESLQKFAVLELCGAEKPPPPVEISRRRADSHAPLKDFLHNAKGKTIIAAGSEGRRESLRTALFGAGFNLCMADSFAGCNEKINLAAAPLRGGFVAKELTVLTETEIFNVRPPPPRRHRPPAAPEKLTIGDAVAHRDYGIGKYAGIKEAGGGRGELIKIEYAEGQILWLPAAHLHLLSPYHGAPAELSKLGGRKWKRARARAEKTARDAAAKLLEIQARRAANQGIAHRPDKTAMAQFAGGFPFEETPDQTAAVRDVLLDMQSPRPMDRLLAADVGFGKTEIAMRAVCACVLSGKQAAVLAPTTLLAEQHARNFADRFAAMPVKIATLTRMLGGRERKEELAAIANGNADIAIGTHALLQPGARFRNLGLAVIDEEHRFGVRQKEYFKSLRANADVLSMSATPIPRTMALAMKGLRDISIISTPPPARLAVHTVIAPFSRGIIVDACERELLRGGQIYFVHNDIAGLPALAEQLQEWMPNLKIGTAHGSMNAPSVETAMQQFTGGGVRMLLATTIVESGLDIAAANTIIINRADCMGAARLHQLRGRVGRAGAQAYAYLLTPSEGAATAQGKKRLAAIAEHGALGDGWFLAMRDLETRGAGEILGERQSGEISEVGYAMYQKMLNTAVRQLSGEEDAPALETIIELSAPALLPAGYVHSPGERLRYYRLLSACKNAEEINAVRLEWDDRFGMPPAEAVNLLASHKLRLLAAAAHAVKLRAVKGAATIEFLENPKYGGALIKQIAKGKCRPGKDGRTVIIENLSETPAQCAEQLAAFLRALAAEESGGDVKMAV